VACSFRKSVDNECQHIRRDGGFSLLEVMITMGILLGLVVGVASMLRSSIDLKMSLARESRITHRLSLAMTRLSWDIEHAFVVGLNDTPRGGSERSFKTIFKIDKGSNGDKLYMTITGNIAGVPDAPPGDVVYVVYEVRDAKDSPGRRHLYRGIMLANRDDIKEDPPMKIFVRNIKSFQVIPWKGSDWTTDRWDSSRGEWRDKMPQMVRLELDTWNEDDEIPRENPLDGSGDNNLVSVKTVVAIQQARGMKEISQPTNSVKWY
jgi:prepilin-type N-terminal cleavage/methylation domain-containing protein